MHQRWRYYGQILHSLWKDIHLSRGFAPSLKAVLKSDICPRGVLVSEGTICYSIGGLKQNAGLLLTPVYDTFFYGLPRGNLGYGFHGSFYNHFLNDQSDSTANQILVHVVIKATTENQNAKLPSESGRNKFQKWPCILLGATCREG